jgi:hypothetical protein
VTENPPRHAAIPHRAETLKVLRLMGKFAPILMLGKHPDDYGTRWTLHGEAVEPAIAKYLMREGYIAENGITEMGARTLMLTASGAEFRADGLRWWQSLRWLEKLKTILRG